MLGQVVNSAGSFAWIYLSLYLVADRGLTPAAAGIVGACYGAGLITGSFAGGFVGDRFGVWRSLLASRFGWAVLCLCVPLTPGFLVAGIVGVAGLVSGAGRPLSFALVGAALPADRRREGMALSRTATNLGFAIGPPLGALLAAWNFGLIFVADALTTVVLALIVWRYVPRAATRGVPAEAVARVPAGLWRSLRADPRVVAVLVTVLVVDTVYRQMLTPLPLLLRDLGEPAVAYGLLLAANGAIIVVFEAPIAVALRHRPALTVIAGGYTLVGVGYLAIGVVASLAAAALAMVVITAGEMLYKPTATAHVADRAPDGMAGRYQGLYAGASTGGMLLAPALGGFAYEHTPTLIWPACAVFAVGAATVVWWAGRRAVRSSHGAHPLLPGRQALPGGLRDRPGV
jgi:MFS family permease